MLKTLFLFVFAGLSIPALAQKMMRLPDAAFAEPLQVKQKTGIGFLRYEFGEYRLVNSRKGWWTKTETATERQDVLSRLLSNVKEVEQTSKEKRSFRLVRNNTDTAIVNIAIATTVYYNQPKNNIFGRHEGPATATRGSSSFLATILAADTTEWIFSTTIADTAGLVNRSTEIAGVLTNGIREIELLPVEEYADGKKAMFLLGYVFRENGVPIAAVQFRGLPLMAHKQNFVWLPKEDNPRLQFVLAAVATALMARAHETQAGGMGL